MIFAYFCHDFMKCLKLKSIGLCVYFCIVDMFKCYFWSRAEPLIFNFWGPSQDKFCKSRISAFLGNWQHFKTIVSCISFCILARSCNSISMSNLDFWAGNSPKKFAQGSALFLGVGVTQEQNSTCLKPLYYIILCYIRLD